MEANHLLVVGRRRAPSSHSDADMNEVSTAAMPTASFHVERCDDPEQLPAIVASVVRRSGGLDLLDLYDHGDIGSLRMGSGILFRSDASPSSPLVGREIAAALTPLLRDTAQVRLLGCRTAAAARSVTSAPPPAGRWLLLKLARMLGGHRIAFGTITSIQRGDFSPLGFRSELEALRLFSSLAALDQLPPSYQERGRNVDTLRLAAVNA